MGFIELLTALGFISGSMNWYLWHLKLFQNYLIPRLLTSSPMFILVKYSMVKFEHVIKSLSIIFHRLRRRAGHYSRLASRT
jgi:hypothetical protein